MNNFDQQELDKFSKLADEWWDPNGKFKPLHLINPLRVSYIEDKVQLKGLDILDIGCGGGILSRRSNPYRSSSYRFPAPTRRGRHASIPPHR